MRVPKLDRRGIPAQVLRGVVPRYRTVGTKYRSIFFQEFMRLVHEAYKTKSHGGTDDLGNSWEPLKKKTIDLKRRRWIPENAEKINIRTGLLVSATRPGKVFNNRYYTPQYQRTKFTERSVLFDITVPYFDKVQAVRPILPTDYTPWIVQAHELAILSARTEFDLINERLRNASQSRNRNRIR